MAHRIIYTPPYIILSSAIGEIEIQADGDYIDAILTATGGVVLLSERYYAFNGRVTLFDLSSLVEAHMRTSGETIADFRLSVYTDTPGNKADTRTLHILYCDRYCISTDIPGFLKENYLTTLSMRRIAPVSTVSLQYYSEKGESLQYTVLYRFRKANSDTVFQHSFTMRNGATATEAGIRQIDISVSSIIADAASFSVTRPGEIEPLSFTVRCGQRSISCFIDPALEKAGMFYFRNCFNVWDSATLPFITTNKTEIDAPTASINGKSQFYDRHASKTYEVETGPLTSDEAEWIDQFFTSFFVIRMEPDATNPDDPFQIAEILITESSCEIKDKPDEPNTAKFTWRYADNRPAVRLSASPGIFTTPYNIVYS